MRLLLSTDNVEVVQHLPIKHSVFIKNFMGVGKYSLNS